MQSTFQNSRQTLGFQKNIVSKIPPGGANVFLALSLLYRNVAYYIETYRQY